MNRYAYRVKRMERRVTGSGTCKVCGGVKRVKLIIGEEEESPLPCHRCGRVWTVVRIVRAQPPVGWEERKRERVRESASHTPDSP